MGLRIKSTGGFNKTFKEFDKLSKVGKDIGILNTVGSKTVGKLADGTPKASGKTAASWDYETSINSTGSEIVFTNSNVTRDGIPVVVLIRHGHGTGTGGYVAPRDFITPIVDDIIKDVSSQIERKL